MRFTISCGNNNVCLLLHVANRLKCAPKTVNFANSCALCAVTGSMRALLLNACMQLAVLLLAIGRVSGLALGPQKQ